MTVTWARKAVWRRLSPTEQTFIECLLMEYQLLCVYCVQLVTEAAGYLNRQVGQLLLSIFLLNCLFLYLYTTHGVSGFSMPLLTEFRFFYVFLCLAQCVT